MFKAILGCSVQRDLAFSRQGSCKVGSSAGASVLPLLLLAQGNQSDHRLFLHYYSVKLCSPPRKPSLTPVARPWSTHTLQINSKQPKSP